MPPAEMKWSARAVACVCAATAWVSLALQLVIDLHNQARLGLNTGQTLVSYFGYFTILTNGLCALIASFSLVKLSRRSGLAVLHAPWLATSAAASIIIVGSVYQAVLRPLWNPTGLQLWVDSGLHYAAPLLFVLFYWVATPARAVRWDDMQRVLYYPLGYLAYIFVRGQVTGLYPYFFLDINSIGILLAARNLLIVCIAFVLVAAGLVMLKRRSIAHQAS